MIDDSYYARPAGVPSSIAASGVVARVEDGRILVAAAYERDHDSPVLPKGHVEPGEDIEEAARREIGEEVGLSDLMLLEKLDTLERLDFAKTEWKITHYYLYLTRQVEATPSDVDGHTTMAWVPIDSPPSFFWPEQQRLVADNAERIARLVEHATRETTGV